MLSGWVISTLSWEFLGSPQSKFMTLDLLEVVAGKIVENHGLGPLDLVLRPFSTNSVSCRLLLAVLGARLHDPEKSADPIDLYIYRLTEQLKPLHRFGAGLPLLFDLILNLVEQRIEFAVKLKQRMIRRPLRATTVLRWLVETQLEVWLWLP
jgi:hypothetical protein